MSQEIDISKYLTEDDMKRIAEGIYREKVEKRIDQLLEDKDLGLGFSTILYRIFEVMVDKYVLKYGDKFEVDFLKICQEEIDRTEPVDENYYMFRQGLTHKLQNAGEKWIENNPDQIQSAVGAMILDQMKVLTAKNFPDVVSKKIDIPGIINQLLTKE